MLNGYYTQIFRTRSFRVDPVWTLARGVLYRILRCLNASATILCDFGPYHFRWRTKALPARFGAAGFFVQRQYYEPLMEFGHRFLEPGYVAIDGGANQGVFTCAFAAAVGSTGLVLAFEPLNYAFLSLKANVALNEFDNCRLFNKALSDSEGEAFIDASSGPVSASITRDFGGGKTQIVPTCTIDSLSLARLDFVKLDVEGAELATLHGAQRSLAAFSPVVCIEAGNEKDYRPVEKFLRTLGYSPHIFDGDGNLIPMPERFCFQFNVFFFAAPKP